MSASSSTSNTGPNRFRGDAASFSPSSTPAYQPFNNNHHHQGPPQHQQQQHHHNQHQQQQYIQQQQQQQQQQQLYMQYANPGYPMMQMGYPPFYMPVYPQDVYYQNQPFVVPQQTPFAPPVVGYRKNGKRYNGGSNGGNGNNTNYNNNGNSYSNGSYNNTNSPNNFNSNYNYASSSTTPNAFSPLVPNTSSLASESASPVQLSKDASGAQSLDPINTSEKDVNDSFDSVNNSGTVEDVKNTSINTDVNENPITNNNTASDTSKTGDGANSKSNVTKHNTPTTKTTTKPTSTNSTGTAAPPSKSTSNTPTTSAAAPIAYPLLINASLEDFSSKRASTLATRRSLADAKYNRLATQQPSDSRLVVRTNATKIIDYNTNTTFIRNDLHNDATNTLSATTTATSNEANEQALEEDKKQADTQIDKDINNTVENVEIPVTPPVTSVSNWASILHSTATASAKKVKHSRSKSSVNSITPATTTASTANMTPSPSQGAESTTTASAPSSAVKFNMTNESAQEMGILILRIMYDPNYSVFGEHNDLPIFKIAPRGLTNTGNICYMNSILQILLYCAPFNRLLKLIETKSIGSLGKTSPTPLLDASIKFFNEFVEKPSNGQPSEVDDILKDKAISPENFYMNLISHEKFQHLKWGQQEDAEEFLGYYLDGLHEEFLGEIRRLNTPSVDSLIQSFSSEYDTDTEKVNLFKFNIKNTVKIIKNDNKNSSDSTKESESNNNNDSNNEWKEVGSNSKKITEKRTVEIEPSPINMIFGGQFKSVLTIPKANNPNQFQKSITLDPFQNLQLDISEADSIEDAFLNLNKLEKISFKSNNNKEVQIKKQTFIDKLPGVLIIHLKRFSFLKDKDVGIEKLRKKVDYTHDLRVPEEVLSNKLSVAQDEITFKLIGVVYHHGSSAEGGHYTSDVLRTTSLNENPSDSEIEGENPLTQEWIRIDDTTLKVITKDEVLNGGTEENIKNAYILLYERYK